MTGEGRASSVFLAVDRSIYVQDNVLSMLRARRLVTWAPTPLASRRKCSGDAVGALASAWSQIVIPSEMEGADLLRAVAKKTEARHAARPVGPLPPPAGSVEAVDVRRLLKMDIDLPWPHWKKTDAVKRSEQTPIDMNTICSLADWLHTVGCDIPEEQDAHQIITEVLLKRRHADRDVVAYLDASIARIRLPYWVATNAPLAAHCESLFALADSLATIEDPEDRKKMAKKLATALAPLFDALRDRAPVDAGREMKASKCRELVDNFMRMHVVVYDHHALVLVGWIAVLFGFTGKAVDTDKATADQFLLERMRGNYRTVKKLALEP